MPPGTDHHYAAYDLTAGDSPADPPVGAYGLMVELVDVTPTGTIASNPFMIGVDNGLTHSISSFGAEGDGDHQQPAADGTQYGAAVAAFEAQMANTAVWNVNSGGAMRRRQLGWQSAPRKRQRRIDRDFRERFDDGHRRRVGCGHGQGPFTAGVVAFDNVGGTNYTLAGDGLSGHGLTLDNNGAGASVNVLGGSHTISTNLTLAERTVFNVGESASLTITGGQIGESSSAMPVYLTGGGTLTIDSASTYSGPTTINGGSLVTTARGSIGAGPLVLNTDNYIASALQIGNSQTVGGLAVTGDGSGSASVSVSAGQTLTVEQPIALDASMALQVGGSGKLRFAAVNGSAAVGSAVTVTIASGASLELAGTVSALSSNVNVANGSTQASGGGLIVSGSNQQVGNVDGAGDLVIEAGGALTANRVNQNALLIGGTPSAPALLTIAASDSEIGGLADDGSGLAVAGPLLPDNSFMDSTAGSGNSLTSLDASGPDSFGTSAAGSLAGAADAFQTAVPEPSTLVLICLGLAAGTLWRRRNRTRATA